MKFGISEISFNRIVEVLEKFEAIDQVLIFGSRSIGNYKKGSDIDLAVFGANITIEEINQISVALNEETPIPYHVDIVHYESLKNDALKQHIMTYGQLFCFVSSHADGRWIAENE